jgi:3-oxoacyl-[acyl-carrier protein] reductase
MLEIKDSVAVITGASGGIGRSIADYWVQNGGRVVLGDIAEEALVQAGVEIAASGGQVATVVCDVTKEDDCAKLADTAIERFG